ncbi:hypothetical protein [uncultured Chryseobacterium sp.]|uniref:hypothetical protein n=1 Tax=uncultured Chryseobacterium sp. TaxID=259322 RepID=UPI0025FE07A3|nr:hypothetical protein [uncultured Chryseobacterium sp.]
MTLLPESFFGSFNAERMTGEIKNFTLLHYKNGELLCDCRYEDGMLLERKDFDKEERHRRIYDYCGNYKITTIYNKSGEVSSKRIFFENHFNISESTNFPINGNEGWEIKKDKPGTEEITFKGKEYTIAYRFENNLQVKLLFDISGCDGSYIINAAYDDLGRMISYTKKRLNDEYDYLNEERRLEYEDDLVIEKLYEDGRESYRITLHDDRKRPLIIAGFDSIEYLEPVKRYVKNPDEKNLLPVIKIIRLEVFDYDKFGNRTWYEEKYYRPDFSKDGLTYYIQDYRYCDKYNIEYGYFYGKTKEDYDDCSEDLTRLEYSENKVCQYRDDQLMAIHYIENEKKIKSEYFRHLSVIRETDEEGNSEVLMQEIDVIEKYDTFGNTVESWVKNSTTGKEDHYEIKVIRN